MIEPRTRPGITPEPKKAEVVRLIFKLYLEGYGLESVALQLEGRGGYPPLLAGSAGIQA
jgi:hypothetical protein